MGGGNTNKKKVFIWPCGHWAVSGFMFYCRSKSSTSTETAQSLLQVCYFWFYTFCCWWMFMWSILHKKKNKKPEFPTEDLTPAAGGCAQIHRSVHTWEGTQSDVRDSSHHILSCSEHLTFEQVKLFIKLQQLKGAPRSPALLFGQAVVNVPLVFRGAPHGDPWPQEKTHTDTYPLVYCILTCNHLLLLLSQYNSILQFTPGYSSPTDLIILSSN